MLTVMILLYNLQAPIVGINHLKSFYEEELYCDANVEFVPRLVNTLFFNPNLCYSWVLLLLPSPSLRCSVLVLPANMFTTPSFGTEPEAFRPIILIIIIAIMFC